MKCNNHPVLDAVGVCEKCGKGLCIDCQRELHKKTYCPPCADEIRAQEAEAALTLTNIKRKTNRDQDKGSKLLNGICAYLAILFIVVFPLGLFLPAASGASDVKKGISISIIIGIAILILPMIFRLIALFSHPATTRRSKMASVGLLLSIIVLLIVAVVSLAVNIMISSTY